MDGTLSGSAYFAKKSLSYFVNHKKMVMKAKLKYLDGKKLFLAIFSRGDFLLLRVLSNHKALQNGLFQYNTLDMTLRIWHFGYEISRDFLEIHNFGISSRDQKLWNALHEPIMIPTF